MVEEASNIISTHSSHSFIDKEDNKDVAFKLEKLSLEGKAQRELWMTRMMV